MNVEEKELLGLIGPNGSGKTTLLNCITGLLTVDSGKIFFGGDNITHLKAHKKSLKGISRTFQLINLFDDMTVVENLVVAAEHHKPYGFGEAILHTKEVKRMNKEYEEEAYRLLDFFGSSPLANRYAKDLSYGQKKMLQIAMGLIPHPKLLLLDEPTAAVNPTMVNQIKKYLLKLHRDGQTMVLVEHKMPVIMELSQRIVVLDQGEKIAEGTPKEIQNNDRVLEAYLSG